MTLCVHLLSASGCRVSKLSRRRGGEFIPEEEHNSPLSNEHCSGSAARSLDFKLLCRLFSLQATSPTQTGEDTELIKHGKGRQEGDPRRLPASMWEQHSEGEELAFYTASRRSLTHLRFSFLFFFFGTRIKENLI